MATKDPVLPRAGRILVVEDNVLFRHMVSEHLRRLGFTVDDAANAEEARQALKGRTYKVVVADIHLPDSTGIELARETHQANPDLPFVFITGDEDESLAREALKQDPAGFLYKPFELTELDALVLHAVQSSRASAAPSVKVADAPEVVRAGKPAAQPYRIVMLKTPSTVAERNSGEGLYIKLAVVVGAILLAAFLLGQFLGPDDPRPLDPDEASSTTRQ
jgi:DNA-binding NtrC family response regulator